MAVVKRIVAKDGKVLGLSIDGDIIVRDRNIEAWRSLRSMANVAFNVLLNTTEDDSDGAMELIAEYERERAGLPKPQKPLWPLT